MNKPELEFRDATPDEAEGSYDFDVKTEISLEELAVLGPKVTKEVCKKYNVYFLNSFTYTKNRKSTITKSTQTYPLFLFDYGEWKKLYQPLNPEKQYRFRYIGNKPKEFINGLSQLEKAYENYRMEQLSEKTDDDRPQDIKKISEAILCSGDRDSLNVAGFGYNVLWMNSETAHLTEKQYKAIMRCVEYVVRASGYRRDRCSVSDPVRDGVHGYSFYLACPHPWERIKITAGNLGKIYGITWNCILLYRISKNL